MDYTYPPRAWQLAGRDPRSSPLAVRLQQRWPGVHPANRGGFRGRKAISIGWPAGVLFTGQKLNRMAYRYVLVMESEEKLRSFMDKIIRVEGYQVLEMADEATLALPDLKVFDLASIEKSHIQRVLNYTRGDRAEAARLLKIGLTTLYRKVAEYQLK